MSKPGPLREFVRSHLDLSNAEIARLGTEQGLELTTSKVASHRYGINQQAKAKPSKPKGTKHAGKSNGKAAAATPDNPNAAAEAKLRRVAFEVGFETFRKVYEEFEALHRGMQ